MVYFRRIGSIQIRSRKKVYPPQWQQSPFLMAGPVFPGRKRNPRFSPSMNGQIQALPACEGF